MAKNTTPDSLYGNSRDILREAERENEILADIAGEEYEPSGDIPKGKYVIEKRLLDAAQKRNELLESIAEGSGTISGANKLAIDYGTDVLSLKKGDEPIANSGVTLPAYGVSFDPTTGGLTLTKNGTAVQGQTVTIPNYGSPVGVTDSADMVDEGTIYLYEGTTGGGFTNGHFYYYDGSAWADGGEYAAATVQTDKTLLVEDRAADAKATGEAVSELKTQLDDISSLNGYVDDDLTIIKGDYISTVTGISGTNSPTRARTNIIDGYNKIGGLNFSSNSYKFRVFFYDSTGNLSTGSGYFGSSMFDIGDVVLPETAVKIAIDFSRNDNGNISDSDVAAIRSSLSFVPLSVVKGIAAKTAIDVESPLDEPIIKGQYISTITGIIGDATARARTDIIEGYNVRRSIRINNDSYMYRLFYYDETGDITTGTGFLGSTSFVTSKTILSVPVNAVKIAIDFCRADEADISGSDITAIYNMVSYQGDTDSTLSKSGKAANAKTVGDALAKTNDVLSNPYSHYIVLSYGYYNGNDNIVIPDSNRKMRAHAIFDAHNGDVIESIDSNIDFIVYEIANDLKFIDLLSQYTTKYVFNRDTHVVISCRNKSNNTNFGDAVKLSNSVIISNTHKAVLENQLNDFLPDNLNKYIGKELTAGTIAYYMDSDIVDVKLSVSSLSNSKIDIIKAPASGSVPRGSAAFVDFDRGYFGFYQGIANSSSVLTIAHEKEIGFSLVANHEYQIEIIKKPNFQTIVLTDAYSLESDSYTVYPSTSNEIGEGWGVRSYSVTGNISVSSFKDFCTEPYNCKLLVIGDSFVEGASIYKNKDLRYAALMKKQLQGLCFIDGVGGATTAQTRSRYNTYAKNVCKPEYVLIACGTNDNNYNTWLTEIQSFISEVEAENSVPVLVTITRRMDIDNLSFMTAANTWIRASGYAYIDINRITTQNFDGQTQEAAYFLKDKVHPTTATHGRIFKRALIDVPQVFFEM